MSFFLKSCKGEEKEWKEDVQLGVGGDLNLDTPEWQTSVLTTTPCHIHFGLQMYP